MIRSSYPEDIAIAIHHRWNQLELPQSTLPSLRSLSHLVDTMYQASLLREEAEQVQCRIAICEPGDFQQQLSDGASSIQVMRFSEECELTPQQIRKLAGAADYYRSLLAVQLNDISQACIWGIISSGTKWVNRVDTFGGSETDLPGMLVLHSIGPGHLIASAGDMRLLETTSGRTLTEGFDPLRSKWLPHRFGDARSNLLVSIDDEVAGTPLEHTKMCDDFIRDLAQSVIRRTLRIVRTRGHGGMLVYLPTGLSLSKQLHHWFRFRVQFERDDSTLRLQHLIVKTVRRARQIGYEYGLKKVTYRDYRDMQDPELARYDEALIEIAHFLADLMSVDGAVTIDRDFRLVGFGAEILGDSHVNTIHRAINIEANDTLEERADSSGTRHRSAYRLVSGLADTIAVVISQDGDVRFVAMHAGRLTYWPYLP